MDLSAGAVAAFFAVVVVLSREHGGLHVGMLPLPLPLLLSSTLVLLKLLRYVNARRETQPEEKQPVYLVMTSRCERTGLPLFRKLKKATNVAVVSSFFFQGALTVYDVQPERLADSVRDRAGVDAGVAHPGLRDGQVADGAAPLKVSADAVQEEKRM